MGEPNCGEDYLNFPLTIIDRVADRIFQGRDLWK